MLPKKKTEDDLIEGFEMILKIPEYIFDLSIPEAKEYLALANKELNEIISISPEFVGIYQGERFLEITEGDFREKVKENLNKTMRKAWKRVPDRDGNNFIEIDQNGRIIYESCVYQFYSKYNLFLPEEFQAPSQLLQILDNTISLLETFLKIPTAKRIFKTASTYVLPRESAVVRLWEKFSESYFPTESLDCWKERWIDKPTSLPAIKIEERFALNNSRHLLITILYEAYTYMTIYGKIDDYIKRRWGLKQYSSNASRYISNRTKHQHMDLIKQILKSE
jgi:hypothetical protein